MATLNSKSAVVRWTLTPHAVAERGDPTWLTCHHHLSSNGSVAANMSVKLTVNDVSDLCELLVGHNTASLGCDRFESTDADFRVGLEAVESDGDLAISIWQGEPYELMKGCRFIARVADLKAFATSLRQESEVLHRQAVRRPFD